MGGYALFAEVPAAQSAKKTGKQVTSRLDILDRQTFGEASGFREIESKRLFVAAATLRRHRNESRPTVMRIGGELYQGLRAQVVYDALNILPVRAEIAREPRDGPRLLGLGDRAEKLPACARQSERGNEAVAPRHGKVRRTKHRQDEVGEGALCGRGDGLLHRDSLAPMST